jgi:hypothetical protein
VAVVLTPRVGRCDSTFEGNGVLGGAIGATIGSTSGRQSEVQGGAIGSSFENLTLSGTMLSGNQAGGQLTSPLTAALVGSPASASGGAVVAFSSAAISVTTNATLPDEQPSWSRGSSGIAGATSATHKVVEADVSHPLTCAQTETGVAKPLTFTIVVSHVRA